MKPQLYTTKIGQKMDKFSYKHDLARTEMLLQLADKRTKDEDEELEKLSKDIFEYEEIHFPMREENNYV